MRFDMQADQRADDIHLVFITTIFSPTQMCNKVFDHLLDRHPFLWIVDPATATYFPKNCFIWAVYTRHARQLLSADCLNNSVIDQAAVDAAIRYLPRDHFLE